MIEKCDCLNHCGDDSRVGRGEVEPCLMWNSVIKSNAINKAGKQVIDAARKWVSSPSLASLRGLDSAVNLYESVLGVTHD